MARYNAVRQAIAAACQVGEVKHIHDKALALFEAESKSSDADFSGFAKKTLPTLKEHKELAEKLPGQ